MRSQTVSYRKQLKPRPVALYKVITACIAAGVMLLLVGGSSAAEPASLLAPEKISGTAFLLITAVSAYLLVIRRRALLSEPILLAVLGYALFVGTGPILLSESFGVRALTTPKTLACTWLGFVCLVAGHWLTVRILGRRAPSAPRPLSQNRLRMMAAVYTALGVIGVALYVYYAGGASQLLLMSYGDRPHMYPSYIEVLHSLMRPALFLLMAAALSAKRASHAQWLVILCYLGFELVWFGPVAGSRRHIISIAITALVLWALAREHLRIPAVLRGGAAALGIGALAFLVVWGGVRWYSPLELYQREAANLSLDSDVSGGFVDSFYGPYLAFSTIVDRVPRTRPYVYGGTLYESLTIVVPREWWRGKPEPLSSVIASEVFNVSPDLLNAVPTWPGELYLNFGLAGIAGGMLLTGVACAIVARLRRAQGTLFGSSAVLYAVAAPVAFQIMWGGSNSAVWLFWETILPMWVAVRFAVDRQGATLRLPRRTAAYQARPAFPPVRAQAPSHGTATSD